MNYYERLDRMEEMKLAQTLIEMTRHKTPVRTLRVRRGLNVINAKLGGFDNANRSKS